MKSIWKIVVGKIMRENKDLNKHRDRLRGLLIAVIAIAASVLVYHTIIIVAQHTEFNALDKSFVGETVATDKVE